VPECPSDRAQDSGAWLTVIGPASQRVVRALGGSRHEPIRQECRRLHSGCIARAAPWLASRCRLRWYSVGRACHGDRTDRQRAEVLMPISDTLRGFRCDSQGASIPDRGEPYGPGP
jgi:hypothetical protein